MKKKVINVILAGGQGTRLWPASIASVPKQFIKFEQISLMARAIDRAMAVSEEDVLVVTSEKYLDLFAQVKEEMKAMNLITERLVLIGEPQAKNTAPAIAYAVRYIEETYGDASVLVTTSDHLITPKGIFAGDVERAVDAANITNENGTEGNIITFGILPSYPETGYGYVEYENKITENAYKVSCFKEKPAYEVAEQYIAKGNYLWNSGMFCFPNALMKKELTQYCKEIAELILENKELYWKKQQNNGIIQVIPEGIDFDKLNKISIDYAVMEHTKQVGLVQASFEWNDIGSWDEAADLLQNNEKHILVKSNNCHVCSDIPVGLVGLDDVVVVVDNGRILVMKKGMGQSVSEVAKKDV